MRSLPFSSLSPPHSLFLLFFLSFFFNGDCQISQLSGISEEKKESEEEFAPLFLSTLLSFAGNVDRSTVTANVLDRRKGLREVPITIEKWVNRRFHFFALLPLSLSFSLSHSRFSTNLSSALYLISRNNYSPSLCFGGRMNIRCENSRESRSEK